MLFFGDPPLALLVLLQLVHKSTVVSLTREMLNYLVVASPEHKTQLCDKITAAAERCGLAPYFHGLCNVGCHLGRIGCCTSTRGLTECTTCFLECRPRVQSLSFREMVFSDLLLGSRRLVTFED